MSRNLKYISLFLVVFLVVLVVLFLIRFYKPIFGIFYAQHTSIKLIKVAEINPSVRKDEILKGIINGYQTLLDLGPKGKEKYSDFGGSYDPTQFHSHKGIAYFLLGNDKEAIKSLDEAIEIRQHTSPEDLIFQGMIYDKQGDFRQAIAKFEHAIKRRSLPEYYNTRAHTYALQADWESAMRDYNKAIELNPKYYEAYYERGYVHYRQGQLAQALNDFNASVEPDSYARKVPYVLLPMYFEQMKHSIKRSSASRISVINPETAGVDYNKAIDYLNQGDFRMAVIGFSKAIEKDPYQSKAFLGRAKAFYAQKEYDKAWEDVYTAQVLGVTVDPEFIRSLKAK